MDRVQRRAVIISAKNILYRLSGERTGRISGACLPRCGAAGGACFPSLSPAGQPPAPGPPGLARSAAPSGLAASERDLARGNLTVEAAEPLPVLPFGWIRSFVKMLVSSACLILG